MSKKLLSSLLAIVLSVSLIPTPVLAASQAPSTPYESTDPVWTYDDPLTMDKGNITPVITDTNASLKPSSGYLSNDEFKISDNKAFDDNDQLFVIVELKTEPLGADAALLSENTGSMQSMSVNRIKLRQDIMIAEQKTVLSEFAAKIGGQSRKLTAAPKMLDSYTAVLNGFAVEVCYKDIALFKEDSRVKTVYLSQKYDLPEAPLGDIASNDIVSAGSAWAAGYDGEGSLIAIVDTGLDYHHELFSSLDAAGRITRAEMEARVNAAGNLNATLGSYYKNDKVIFGYDYSDSDEDPMDEINHGTHVAGISAANTNSEGLVMGVAPKAQVMAMKVFPNSYDHTIIAAVDDAVKLGADSINLSLGSPAAFAVYDENYESFYYTEAFSKAKDAGAQVVISSGNSAYVGIGPTSVFGVTYPYASNPDYGLSGMPSADPLALSVASSNNTHMFTSYMLANGEKALYTDSNYVPINVQFNGRELDYIAVGGSGFGALEDYEGIDVTGKIALVSRGGVPDVSDTFELKVKHAATAGAIGVVVYNNVSSAPSNMSLGNEANSIPAVMIWQSVGQSLKEAGSGTMQFSTDFLGFLPQDDEDSLSYFSSWGVVGLHIKPEITAPGGNIYSTLPGGYGTMSGTSMAAPHITGGAAVIKQRVEEEFSNIAHTPGEKIQLQENLMVSTAQILLDSEGLPYPVQGQGAGVMDIKGAVNAQAVLYNEQDHNTKVELMDKLDPDAIQVQFVLENISDDELTFDMESTFMADDTYALVNEEDPADKLHYDTLRSRIVNESNTVTFTGDGVTYDSNTSQVTLPARVKTVVTVTYDIDDAEKADLNAAFKNGYIVDGFVTFKPVISDVPSTYTLSIPFLGFVGDWMDAPGFDPGSIYEVPEKISDMPYYMRNNLYARYGSFSVAPMGCNLYMEGQPVAGKDYLAFAPKNQNYYFNEFAPLVVFMRNLRNIWMEVTDAEGNVIKRVEDEYFTKNFYNLSTGTIEVHGFMVNNMGWNGKDANGNFVPDGVYTFTMYGTPDYTGGEDHVYQWSLDVTVDNTRPSSEFHIIEGTGENEGKTFITVTAKDNHYLQYLVIRDEDRTLKEYALIGPKEFTTEEIDITPLIEKYGSLEKTKDKITARAVDYAFNMGIDYTGYAPPAITDFTLKQYYYLEGLPAIIKFNLTADNLPADGTLKAVISGLPDSYEVHQGINSLFVPKMPSYGTKIIQIYAEELKIYETSLFCSSSITPTPLNARVSNSDPLGKITDPLICLTFKGAELANDCRPIVSVDGVPVAAEVKDSYYLYIYAPFVQGSIIRIDELQFKYSYPSFQFNMIFTCPTPGTTLAQNTFTPSNADMQALPDADGPVIVNINGADTGSIGTNPKQISITFDRPMNTSAEGVVAVNTMEGAMGALIRLSGGTWDNEGKMITFDYSKSLTLVDGQYSLILSKFKDVNGKTMAINEDYTYSLQTVPVMYMVLNAEILQLHPNETVVLTAEIAPANATDKLLSWHSSNPQVAEVDRNGLVTAKAPGYAVISVTAANGNTAVCEVNVDTPEVSEIEVVSIKIDSPALTIIRKNQTLPLSAVINPSNATCKDVNWTSSNNAIATVDENGLVTAVGTGSVIITATSANGKKSSISLKINL